MLKPTIFREYDIRGVADVELPDAGIQALGQAFGTYLQRHAGPHITLGRDTRLSSRRLRDALIRGLKASGCRITDLGIVPATIPPSSTASRLSAASPPSTATPSSRFAACSKPATSLRARDPN
jgi:phosphomannomutase